MKTILIDLLVFGILVLFHEFGHFSVAKLVGIKVHEFAIGMGPRIFNARKGETEYSLRILPIGGYVKMEGEDEASFDQRSFSNKPLWARISVIIAGPLMNFILAILLFCLIGYMSGIPSNTTVIGSVIENNPAQVAGIEAGDKIISIDGKVVQSWDEVVKIIHVSKDKELNIKIMRGQEEKTFDIKPVVDEKTKNAIVGISPTFEKSFIKSIPMAFKQLIFIMKGMIDFFVQLFMKLFMIDTTKDIMKDMVGPVGIIHLIGEAAKTSIYNLLSLAAIISINLGMVNLLPIPALDGGRLVFLLVEALRGKPLDPEKEGFIHFAGFVLLMGLMIFMVYKDVIRFNLL